MTHSPLAGRKFATNKKSNRRGNVPEQFIIHHTAGGSNALAIRMLSGTLGPNDKKVSAHIILLTTGEAVASVEEEYRAWTTGWAADKNAITVETVNSSGAPHWRVTNAQLEKLAQLAADYSIRYGWGPLTRQNVRGHREFAATACPGPHIWPNMDNIIARANQIRAERLDKPDVPAAPPASTPPQGSLAALDRLIIEIIRGKYGNGEERVAHLKRMGYSDDAIKAIAAEVTRRFNALKAASTAPSPPPPPPPSKPTSAELIAIHKMIMSIIRGDWGNGEERVERLKAAGYSDSDIKALQAAVTEQMRK